MRPVKLIAACLGAATALYSFTLLPVTKSDDSTVIKIATGLISGVKNDGVTAYKGIPFALPPVKELRWRAPQPARPWTGIKKCETFGPDPYQPAPKAISMWSEEFFIPATSTRSEDCLYLNVWTPAKSPKEKRPVVSWMRP